MTRNSYRKLVLLALNLLIVVHAYAWFALEWRGVGHSDPRESIQALATGVVGVGAIVLVVAIVATLIGGRLFCGWFCHMGAWQEVATWLQAKVGIKRQILHSRLTGILPVVMLVLWALHYELPRHWQENGFPTTFVFTPSQEPIFQDTFTEGWTRVFSLMFELGVFLFGMQFFFGSKGVCRYLCPWGAVFRVADKVALFRLRKVNNDCDDCNECNRVCLMGIDVLGDLKRHGQVNDTQCIKCMTCVDVCHTQTIGFTAKAPEKFGVTFDEPKKRWVKRQAPLLVDLGLIAMVIAVFALLPWEKLQWMMGDGAFMLFIPLVCFAGLMIVNAYRRYTASKAALPPNAARLDPRVPKSMQKNRKGSRYNSLGKGW